MKDDRAVDRTTIITTPTIDVFIDHPTGLLRLHTIDGPRPTAERLRAELMTVIEAFEGVRRGHLRLLVDLRGGGEALKQLVEELEARLSAVFLRVAFLGYTPQEDDDARIFVANDEADALYLLRRDW